MTNERMPRANTSYTMPTEGPKPCVECQRLQARLDGVMAENERLKRAISKSAEEQIHEYLYARGGPWKALCEGGTVQKELDQYKAQNRGGNNA